MSPCPPPGLDRRPLLCIVCIRYPVTLARSPTMLGLPLGTVIALAVIIALPLTAYGLYRIDEARGDGHVTVFGYRGIDAE